jgi:hypothetical protein
MEKIIDEYLGITLSGLCYKVDTDKMEDFSPDDFVDTSVRVVAEHSGRQGIEKYLKASLGGNNCGKFIDELVSLGSKAVNERDIFSKRFDESSRKLCRTSLTTITLSCISPGTSVFGILPYLNPLNFCFWVFKRADDLRELPMAHKAEDYIKFLEMMYRDDKDRSISEKRYCQGIIHT